MTGLDNLRALALGMRPTNDGLLANAKYSWGGRDLLGEEAILASFAAHPFSIEPEPLSIETPQGAALITDSCALLADIYSGRIGRLWRVENETEKQPERAIDVAFDADMKQERGDVSFRADEHPDLDASAAEHLMKVSRNLIERVRLKGNLRARGFVVRAFSDRQKSAALVSVFALDNEQRRSASFAYAVVSVAAGDLEERIVYNQPQPREWNPRF